jgi:hypothetical protein
LDFSKTRNFGNLFKPVEPGLLIIQIFDVHLNDLYVLFPRVIFKVLFCPTVFNFIILLIFNVLFVLSDILTGVVILL